MQATPRGMPTYAVIEKLHHELQLEAGGKPSTWFPPGGLVRREGAYK